MCLYNNQTTNVGGQRTLRCAALRCAALRCAALRFAALRCAALRCAALPRHTIVTGTWNRRKYMVEKSNFEQIRFQVLRKVSIVSEDLMLMGQWMQLAVLLQQQFCCVAGRRMLATNVWPIQFWDRPDF